MGYRILYFYADRGREGGTLTFSERELGGEEGELRVFSCGVSEHYGIRAEQAEGAGRSFSLFAWLKRRVRWRGRKPHAEQASFKEKILSLMRECCANVSADACYLEEGFERELAEGGLCFETGRQRMCGELMGKLCGGLRTIDGILYLGGETEEGELPIPGKLLRKLRYFFYRGTDAQGESGRREERRAALEENLWQEYGMPLLSVEKMAELAAWQIGRLLVIDDRREGDADLEMLPHGSVYLDLWSDAARRAQVEKNRADVKYLSEYLYLKQNLQAL